MYKYMYLILNKTPREDYYIVYGVGAYIIYYFYNLYKTIINVGTKNKYFIDSQLKYDYSTAEVCSGGLIHMFEMRSTMPPEPTLKIDS